MLRLMFRFLIITDNIDTMKLSTKNSSMKLEVEIKTSKLTQMIEMSKAFIYSTKAQFLINAFLKTRIEVVVQLCILFASQ